MRRELVVRSAVAILTGLSILVAGTTLAHTASAAPATSSSWGWEQLKPRSLEPWQFAALRAALIAAQPAAKVDARRQALAPLVTSGAVTPSQAELLAAVNSRATVDALVASGDFTKARAAAVLQVINGYSRTQARYSAAKFALELLTSTGILNHAEAEDVRAQLVSIR